MPNNFISSGISDPNDPFWAQVSLYIKGNGVDQSPAIVDEKGHVLTKTGTIVLSNAASMYPGGTSIQFNGAQKFTAAATGSEFAMGSGDFTHEAWVLQTARAANTNWLSTATSDNGLILQISSAGGMSLSGTANGISMTKPAGNPSSVVPFGTWAHIALCRSGGNLRYYLNGVQVLQVIGYAGTLTDNVWCLGAHLSNAGPFTGYMQDIRTTKGVARYNADFTPGYGYPTHA